MRVGSTFTGVGGADMGFEAAGMTVAWQCELDAWKRSVLAAHYPSIPIYDDITTLFDPEPVDLMVGGFPCQDLSIAGKRKGFTGERSVLAFEFLRLAETLKPRWIVLENVPGLLSSNKGLDFQRLLREVAACGYGVGYRCLDARYFGVPQRRRRIFVVARRVEAGVDPRAASGFALQSLCESGGGDTTPCVPPWQDTTRTIEGSVVAYRKSARVSKPGTPETWVEDGRANTLNSFDVGDVRTTHAVVKDCVARRFSPTEHEALMGWPRNWTAPEGVKAPDSRRYAACGDGIVANVAYWIGQRIMQIDKETQ
jgi:DNA (cytosine-5)-methyltransferase 1